MAGVYETDIVLWSEQQSDLLRRLAAGERVNDQVDWENVVEEIESVGRSEVRGVTSVLKNAIQHKLYQPGWPRAAVKCVRSLPRRPKTSQTYLKFPT